MEKEAIASFFYNLIKLLSWLNYSRRVLKIIKNRSSVLNPRTVLTKILIISYKAYYVNLTLVAQTYR